MQWSKGFANQKVRKSWLFPHSEESQIESLSKSILNQQPQMSHLQPQLNWNILNAFLKSQPLLGAFDLRIHYIIYPVALNRIENCLMLKFEPMRLHVGSVSQVWQLPPL